MKRISVCIAVLYAVIFTCFSVVNAEDHIYTAYDFEEFADSNAGMPSGLSKYSGYMTSPTDASHTGKYLSFQNAGSKLQVNMPAAFIEGDDKILVSADIRITNTNSSALLFGFAMYSSPGTNIQFTADKKVKVGAEALAEYKNNVWYTVEAVIDKLTQKANIFLDGEIIGEDVAWTWSASYNKMFINPVTSGSNYSVNIDNLLYTDDPQYFPEKKEYFGIESITPEDGAEDVPLSTTVIIKFEKPVVYTDGEPLITLTGGAYEIKSLKFDDEMKELTVELAGLDYASVYTMEFNKELRSTDGAYLSPLVKASFSTEYLNRINTFDEQLTTDPENEKNKVYSMSAVPGGSSERLVLSDVSISGSSVTVSISVYVPPSVELNYLCFCPITDQGKANNDLFLMADGSVRYQAASNPPVTGTNLRELVWKKGQWHTVSFEINTGTKKGSYYFNGYPIALNTSGNFDSIRSIRVNAYGSGSFYVDDLSITNDPNKTTDTSFAIAGSTPENGAVNVYSDSPTIYIDFNKRVDKETLASTNFTLTGGNAPVDISDISLINGDKTVALRLNGQLSAAADYTLTVSNILSEYGIAMIGGNTITFTSEAYVGISDIGFSDDAGNPMTELENGIMKVSVNAVNHTSEPANATLFISLCKGDEECFYVEDLTIVKSGDIACGGSELLEGEIDVPDKEGRFVKVLIWDTEEAMNSLHIFENLYPQTN